MKYVYLFVLLCQSFVVLAQPAILDEKITLKVTDTPLEEILAEISEAGGFFFSYNAAILDVEKRLTVAFDNVSIKTVLDHTVNDPSIRYREIGNHIILLKQSPPHPERQVIHLPKTVQKKPVFVTISGQIMDAETGRHISQASILEENLSLAAISNETGYFQLRIPEQQQQLSLIIRHRFYKALTLTYTVDENKRVEVNLAPRILTKVPAQDIYLASNETLNPVRGIFMVDFLINEKMLSQAPDPNAISHRLAQFSFIPPFGTNGKKSGQRINHLSLNLLAGYAHSLQGLEVGGLLNVTRGKAQGVQIAGFGNAVGGETMGIQAAGFFNVNRESVYGAQIAGFNNWADSLEGAQISPVNNVLKGNLAGVQATGLVNIAAGNIQGVQASGLINIGTNNVRGLQVAGLFNWGSKLDGVQVAGLANVSSGNFTGLQLAPLFNIGKKGKGVQIGLINVCDSLDGVPIGLINLVKNGYNGIELGSGIALPATFRIKTGNHRLYNIFGVSYRPKADEDYWGYGYGLGTAFKLTKRSHAHLELMTWQINTTRTMVTDLNLLNQLHLTYHYALSRHLEIHAGPVLNVHISNYLNDENNRFLTPLGPEHIFEDTQPAKVQSQFWLGAHVGIALLK